MFRLRILAALLSFLLAANALSFARQSDTAETEEPVAASTVGDFVSEDPENYRTGYEYTSSPDSSEPDTAETEEPVAASTVGDFVSEDPENYRTGNEYTSSPASSEVYRVECGISYDNTLYLGAFPDNADFEISSNTAENTTYSNSQNCRVQFRTGESPVALTLHFEHFDLESNSQCSFDSLCVKGIKMCGSWQYQQFFSYVVPAYNSFTMLFNTDSSVTRSGFKIKVFKSPTNDSLSYEPYGIPYGTYDEVVRSFQWRNQSEYVDACEVEDNTQSTTWAENWSTENYQYTSSNPWGDDGRDIVQCEEGSSTNYLYLQSSSYGDDYNSYRQSNVNNRYVIQSTNYGVSNYSNSTNCEVKFYTSSSRKRLTLHYNSFDLEKSYSCNFDSLCVGGLKYCGNWETNKYFYYDIPAYSWFTIKFTTDGSVVRPGFEAELTFEDSPVDSNYQATGGDGSEEATVSYTWTYDSLYQDKCASDYQASTTYETPTSHQPPAPDSWANNDYSSDSLRNEIRLLQAVIDAARQRVDNGYGYARYN